MISPTPGLTTQQAPRRTTPTDLFESVGAAGFPRDAQFGSCEPSMCHGVQCTNKYPYRSGVAQWAPRHNSALRATSRQIYGADLCERLRLPSPHSQPGVHRGGRAGFRPRAAQEHLVWPCVGFADNLHDHPAAHVCDRGAKREASGIQHVHVHAPFRAFHLGATLHSAAGKSQPRRTHR